jgi:hypothetical protein
VELTLEVDPVGAESGPGTTDALAYVTGRITMRTEPMLARRDSLGPEFDVVVALDTSAGTLARFETRAPWWKRLDPHSSSARGFAGSLLEAEVWAARELLARLDPRWTRVALVTSAHGTDACPPGGLARIALTDDFDAVERALDEIGSEAAGGEPDPAAALRAAEAELLLHGATDREPFVVLMIDAAGHALNPDDRDAAHSAAAALGEAGVRIHALALAASDPPAPPGATLEASALARLGTGQPVPGATRAELRAGIGSLTLSGFSELAVTNRATGSAAGRVELGADGRFEAAVPVTAGSNPLEFRAHGPAVAGSASFLLAWPAEALPEPPAASPAAPSP